MSNLYYFEVILAIFSSIAWNQTCFYNYFRKILNTDNQLQNTSSTRFRIMRRFRLKIVKSTPSKQIKEKTKNKIRIARKAIAPGFKKKLQTIIWSLILISPLLISCIMVPVDGLENQNSGVLTFKQPTRVSANLCARVHQRARCGTGDISAFLENQCCRLVVLGA